MVGTGPWPIEVLMGHSPTRSNGSHMTWEQCMWGEEGSHPNPTRSCECQLGLPALQGGYQQYMTLYFRACCLGAYLLYAYFITKAQ